MRSLRPLTALAALAALLVLILGLAGMPAAAVPSAFRGSKPTTLGAASVVPTTAALPTPEPDNPLHFKGHTVKQFTSAPHRRRDSSDGGGDSDVDVTTTDLEYDVVLKPSCVRLNIDPNVITVQCSPTSLAITVRDPALMPASWAVGAIFNGGPHWNCTASPQDIRLGFPPDAIVAFNRRAVSVTIRDHTVEIRTAPAALGECFERATINHELTHTHANVSAPPQRRAPTTHERPVRWTSVETALTARPLVEEDAAVIPTSEAAGELTKRACPGINNVRFNKDFNGQLHANEWLSIWWDLCNIDNGRLIRVQFYRNVKIFGDKEIGGVFGPATITANEWRNGRSFKLDSSHRRDEAEFYAEITIYYLSYDCSFLESEPCERTIGTVETPRFAFPITDFTQPAADAQFHWSDYISVAWTQAHPDATLRLKRNVPLYPDDTVKTWDVSDMASAFVTFPFNPCSGSGSIDREDFLPYYFELKFACGIVTSCTTVTSRPFYVPCTNSYYLTLGSPLINVDDCYEQETVLGQNLCTRRTQVFLTCDNCYVYLRDTTISSFQLNINSPFSGDILESFRVGLQGTVDLNVDLNLHILADWSWSTEVGKITTTIAGSPSLDIAGVYVSMGLYLTTLFSIDFGLRARADASATYSGKVPFKIWYDYSNGNAEFYKDVDVSSLTSTGSSIDGSIDADAYLTVDFDVEASASVSSLARAYGTLSPSVTPKIRGALPPYAPTSSPMDMSTAWVSVKMDVCAAKHYVEYAIALDVELLYGITVLDLFSDDELVSWDRTLPLYSGNVLRGCALTASSTYSTGSVLPRVIVSLPFAPTFSAALQTAAQSASVIFDALAKDVSSALASVSSLSSYGLAVEAVSPTRIRIGLVGQPHATTQAATDFAYQVQQTLSAQLASPSSTLRLGSVTRYLDSVKSVGVAVTSTTLSSSAYFTTDDQISLAALPAPAQPENTSYPTITPYPTSPGGGSGGGGNSSGSGGDGSGPSTSDNSISGPQELGLPVIIGIAVGGAVLLAAIVAVSVMVIRRRRKAHASSNNDAEKQGSILMMQPIQPPAMTAPMAPTSHYAPDVTV